MANSLLRDVPACPLCGSLQHDGESTPPSNLYSEQLALIAGCDEVQLRETVRNRRCADCGLWYKPRWFRQEALHTLFTKHVPTHPKGWDAVSGRFSESGLLADAAGLRRAVAENDPLMAARYRRSLLSIVDSVVDIDALLRQQLQDAITQTGVEALAALLPALDGHFARPAAFKRFSGFSSHRLWDWVQSHLGEIREYAEVGCPLWGQLTRTGDGLCVRHFYIRSENNYWGSGCCQAGQHCCQRLAANGNVHVQAWPPAADTRLDALGAFQYIDHLEDPATFVAEVFHSARALLLILDGVDAPLAIQHFTGWDARSIERLAAMHGKRVVSDFSEIEPSGNRAWLLF